MKRLFFVTLIALTSLFCAAPVMSQTFFYKLHMMSVWEIDDDGNFTDNQRAEETSGVIAFSEKDKKLVIDMPNVRLLYTIIERTKKEGREDGDGDKYIRYSYSAIDKDVLRCTIIIDDYVEYSDTQFYIRYKDAMFAYSTNFVQYNNDDEEKTEPKEEKITPTVKPNNTITTYTVL